MSLTPTTLGAMNWAALLNYVVQPSDMALFQSYMTSPQSQTMAEFQTPGVLYGCQITPVAGLQIQVAAGAVLMPNGQLIFMPALTATLGPADSVNPRIDRIEIAYTNVNNTQVVDVNGLTKTLDILYQPAINVVAGVAGVTPVAPTKTSSNVSVGLINVTAGLTTLTTGNISQIVDAGKDLSATKVGDNAGWIRYNNSLASFQVSSNLITWSSLSVSPLPEQQTSLANNQTSAAAIAGFVLDTVIASSFEVNVEIRRSTATNTIQSFGKLFCYFDSVAGVFQITPQVNGDDPGVDFSTTQVGSSTAYQVNAATTNISGSGYTGQIKFAVVSAL